MGRQGMTRKCKGWKFKAKEDKRGEAKTKATEMKEKVKQHKKMKEKGM